MSLPRRVMMKLFVLVLNTCVVEFTVGIPCRCSCYNTKFIFGSCRSAVDRSLQFTTNSLILLTIRVSRPSRRHKFHTGVRNYSDHFSIRFFRFLLNDISEQLTVVVPKCLLQVLSGLLNSLQRSCRRAALPRIALIHKAQTPHIYPAR